MSTFMVILVLVIFFGAFVAFPLFLAWDLKRKGYLNASNLAFGFAAFVVIAVVVDLVFITALGTNATHTFSTVVPPAPANDK